jgi:UDP-N-acetylglucosamine acyltransferase
MAQKIDSSCSIHPTAIMEGDIEIGAKTSIGPGCYLKGPLVIGERNSIGPNVMLGVDPEHKSKGPQGVVRIGNENVIREFVTLQRGIGERDTEIEDNCYIMTSAYIAHDCLIESEVILCAKVGLSGHCHVLKGAILGLGSVLHQHSTIGAHAFVGMGSVVVKDVLPFCVVMGNPAAFGRFNTQPLDERGLELKDLEVVDGMLVSQQPYIQECVNAFANHSRRKTIPIVMHFDHLSA